MSIGNAGAPAFAMLPEAYRAAIRTVASASASGRAACADSGESIAASKALEGASPLRSNRSRSRSPRQAALQSSQWAAELPGRLLLGQPLDAAEDHCVAELHRQASELLLDRRSEVVVG